MTTTKLDLTGLKCPLPALKTRKALKALSPGDLLEVHCTDPLSVIDIPNLIRETGDRVEITERAEHRDRVLDRKSKWSDREYEWAVACRRRAETGTVRRTPGSGTGSNGGYRYLLPIDIGAGLLPQFVIFVRGCGGQVVPSGAGAVPRQSARRRCGLLVA